ncbi:hypothetical protein OJ996_00705 [Luteolibacter sp. GHJ8]|uniref:HEAT repeat protein n=1 Tax=Luteolibacter rhizosphaerae TaxID=2989719 RepID=A0ABT3FWY3_9BACT|nr:hypothetical protein [Luteolibacter rhizosphaerae]MCW1912072.1 hypothetical protein [Luteolibacter rhizosphaerae]
MPRVTPALLLTFTHALALGAGWIAYQTTQTDPPADKQTAPASDHSPRDKELSRRAQRIIDAARTAADQTYHRGLSPEDKEEIGQAIRSIRIPDDIPAALETIALSYHAEPGESGPLNPEAAALLYHWLARDPEAAFAWAKTLSGPVNGLVGDHLGKAFAMQAELQEPASLLPMLLVAEKHAQGRGMASILADRVARQHDATLIARVKASASKETWNEFMWCLPREWPADRSADFVQFAIDQDSLDIIAAFKPGPDLSWGHWMKNLLEDESVPESFREKLRNHPRLRQQMSVDTTLPLADRLALSGRPDTPQTRADIGRRDIENFLGNEDDWPRAVKLGEATAAEVLAAVTAANPDIAASSPDMVRDLVFSRLVKHDPAAAMSLLAALPPDERSQRALYAARTDLKDATPPTFLALLQQVPSDSPGQWEDRLDAWNRSSIYQHDWNGEHYTAWVKALPPGLDREMALYSLARRTEKQDPELAASLRAGITDPTLKSRLPAAP